MLVRPDERVPIARLLRFLEQGEHLARHCARAQAALVSEPGPRGFLLGQARQEMMHALVFQSAIAWLAPRHLKACPLLPPLERYRALIGEALARQDLAETLMAEQIILEGLGEAILSRIEAGLVTRGAPFSRLRRLLLHQEEAHYSFGRRMLERLIAAGHTTHEALTRRAQEYLSLTEEMVATLAHLFESIDEDPAAWLADARTYLPHWLVLENQGPVTFLSPLPPGPSPTPQHDLRHHPGL